MIRSKSESALATVIRFVTLVFVLAFPATAVAAPEAGPWRSVSGGVGFTVDAGSGLLQPEVRVSRCGVRASIPLASWREAAGALPSSIATEACVSA